MRKLTALHTCRNGGPPPPVPPSAWARARRAAVELTAEAIEQIAERVAELLHTREQTRAGHGELLDAAELARRLGVSRDWVYEHANELGAIMLGDGRKPRLRFDLEVATRAIAARKRRAEVPRPQSSPTRRAPRRRKRPQGDAKLLPVYEPRARGLFSRLAIARRRRT